MSPTLVPRPEQRPPGASGVCHSCDRVVTEVTSAGVHDWIRRGGSFPDAGHQRPTTALLKREQVGFFIARPFLGLLFFFFFFAVVNLLRSF